MKLILVVFGISLAVAYRQTTEQLNRRECCICPYDPTKRVVVGKKDTNGHNFDLAESDKEVEWRQDTLPDTRCCPCTMQNQWQPAPRLALDQMNEDVLRQKAMDV